MYEWTDSGYVLLKKIEDEINKAGGNEMLANKIIAQAPEWFSPEEYSTARALVETVRRLPPSIIYTPKGKKIWTKADDRYIIDNLGVLSTTKIAQSLRCSRRQAEYHIETQIRPKLMRVVA